MLLSPKQFDVLHELVVHAGRIVSKNHLIEVAWHGEAVSDSNLEKIIAQLRQRLDLDAFNRHIETVPRRGYRFIAPVVPTDAELTDAELTPFRVLMDGRAAIETLERAQIAEARELLGHLVVRHSRQAGFQSDSRGKESVRSGSKTSTWKILHTLS
jgi:DNA-binding winged helix-turn-helix (wHTH) protein